MNIHSAIVYSSTASKIILSAKENGLRAADELISNAIIHVLKRADFSHRSIRLIPIPSSLSARRRRGRSFIVDIAKEVSLATGYPSVDALELVRKVQDQTGLHARARAINMNGAFAIKSGAYPRGDLILIDDVVTTGATLGEAARALSARGFHVLGSVTACVAQPLR